MLSGMTLQPCMIMRANKPETAVQSSAPFSLGTTRIIIMSNHYAVVSAPLLLQTVVYFRRVCMLPFQRLIKFPALQYYLLRSYSVLLLCPLNFKHYAEHVVL